MKMPVFLVLFLTFLSAYAPLQTEALNVRGHLLKSKTWLLLGVMSRNGCSTCTPFDVTDRALLEGKSEPACKVVYQVECSSESQAKNDCVDVMVTKQVLPRGGDSVYGVAHQHSGGIGASLHGHRTDACYARRWQRTAKGRRPGMRQTK